MQQLRVDAGSASYPIFLGEGLLETAGAVLTPLLPSNRVFIVSESTVAPLYVAILKQSLEQHQIEVQSCIIPVGEASKCFEVLEHLTTAMLTAKVDRKTTVIALGGGVIGDLAGFAAAIVQRGLPFVQIPTTLLAQVDSSVGGKTGINTALGKNLVGAFWQPLAVVMDTAVLATLPPRHLRAGYAEIVKYGLLGDAAFFAWLEANGAQVLAREEPFLSEAIATSVKAKAAIVAKDERESGIRALLNLGHTFGHALEADTGFSERLHHGEAVAFGCLLAAKLSVNLGYLAPAEEMRIRAHYESLGFPLTLKGLVPHHSFDVSTLLAHMAGDKKAFAGVKTFVLLNKIGTAFLAANVPDAAVMDVLTEFL